MSDHHDYDENENENRSNDGDSNNDADSYPDTVEVIKNKALTVKKIKKKSLTADIVTKHCIPYLFPQYSKLNKKDKRSFGRSRFDSYIPNTVMVVSLKVHSQDENVQQFIESVTLGKVESSVREFF